MKLLIATCGLQQIVGTPSHSAPLMVYPLIVASLNHQDVDEVKIVEIFQAVDSYLAHEFGVSFVGC